MNKDDMNLALLKHVHQAVWDFRTKNEKWFRSPSTLVSMRFACTEIGETEDIHIRDTEQEFLRHTMKHVTVGEELADTLLMMLSAAGQEITDKTFMLAVHQDTNERCTILAIGAAIWNLTDLYDSSGGRYYDYTVSCLHISMRLIDLMIKLGYSPVDELNRKLNILYTERIVPKMAQEE